MAVIARLLFEALQRFHKLEREALPTVLVLEEAHVFVQKGRDDASETPSPVQMCCRGFERIAREGRKFGMGLVLASRRPSEVSATVLSQCNTFLLHRLVNDADQDLVRKLIPETFAGLLRELPVLPSRHAVLLVHATAIPKLLVMNQLPESQRPRAKDPSFWEVWSGELARPVDWQKVTSDWVGAESTGDASGSLGQKDQSDVPTKD